MANKLYKVSKSKWAGVYAYKSETRKNQGKKDICYYITYKYSGVKKTEKIGWASEGYSPQIAQEIRAKRIRDLRHGNKVKTKNEIRSEKIKSNRTVGEIKESYFDSAHGMSLKGRVTDLNRYDKHLAELFHSKPVSTLSPSDIESLKTRMKGLSTGTISNSLELLRRLINYGVNHQLCPQLSFKISLPKKNNEVTEYLNPQELKRLQQVLDTWPNQDVARMLRLALYTGMRRGEIFKLSVSDVDFYQNLIWLRDPKGDMDVSIPMSKIVKIILKAQIAWVEDRFPNCTYVFPTVKGTKRSDSTAVNRIKKKANLPESFRIFHGLRHNLGVTLANSGEYTIDMIGELLTHKNPAITKRYAQFLPETKQEASERASEIINNSVQKGSDI